MTADQQSFINTIGQAAVKHYPKYKVLPSLTIAQIIKESGWGKSGLAKTCFNYTGMKWTSGCGYDYKEYPTKEWDGKKYITIMAKFIKFKNAEEGIEGHYKFIHKYKRYKPVIGEIDAYKACVAMGNSGWATAPNYGASLWNDYVVPYNLKAWDALALGKAESVPNPEVTSYVVGQVYALQNDLYVRGAADGSKLKYDNLTEDGKKNAYYDQYGNAILKKGTKVTCKEVSKLATSIWVKIPSGWICAKSKDKTYLK